MVKLRPGGVRLEKRQNADRRPHFDGLLHSRTAFNLFAIRLRSDGERLLISARPEAKRVADACLTTGRRSS